MNYYSTYNTIKSIKYTIKSKIENLSLLFATAIVPKENN